MVRALCTAPSGMMVERRRMELLAHNLGNVETPGFRSSGLVRQGVPTAGSAADVQGLPVEAGVVQGSLEAANVDGVAGMTRMIEILRAFEAYQKVIQTVGEVTSQAVRMGRVAIFQTLKAAGVLEADLEVL